MQVARSGQGMYFLQIVFTAMLLACSVYASILGGRTGRMGAAIFVIATVLSNIAARYNPNWASTSFGVMWVDTGCLVGLLVLALRSNRYWPIWALGFQTIAVATHLATIIAPDIVPRAYQAIAAFWSIPILAAMVTGTTLDWQHSQRT
jgi:hypothetical protein